MVKSWINTGQFLTRVSLSSWCVNFPSTMLARKPQEMNSVVHHSGGSFSVVFKHSELLNFLKSYKSCQLFWKQSSPKNPISPQERSWFPHVCYHYQSNTILYFFFNKNNRQAWKIRSTPRERSDCGGQKISFEWYYTHEWFLSRMQLS